MRGTGFQSTIGEMGPAAREQGRTKKCPQCGEGDLVDIVYRGGSEAVPDEEIQEADTRQVEIYSCGHEVTGPALDFAAGSDDLEVERRQTNETVDPL